MVPGLSYKYLLLCYAIQLDKIKVIAIIEPRVSKICVTAILIGFNGKYFFRGCFTLNLRY